MDIMPQLLSNAWVMTPMPSIIYNVAGAPVAINRVGRTYFGFSNEDLAIIPNHYSVYTDPTLVAHNMLDTVRAAFAGTPATLGPFDYAFLNAYAQPYGRSSTIEVQLLPLRINGEYGEYMTAYYRDITNELELKEQIQAQALSLQAAAQIQEQLRDEIEQRGLPVVPLLAGIMVLPIVGALDSQRALDTMSTLLEAATAHGAHYIIIDITGVPIVDTQVANYLLQSIKALRLVGAETILVGIGPEIAQTIVQLGLRLDEITTRSNLQSGLEYALAQQGLAIVRRSPMV